jgi:hypothetical protein
MVHPKEDALNVVMMIVEVVMMIVEGDMMIVEGDTTIAEVDMMTVEVDTTIAEVVTTTVEWMIVEDTRIVEDLPEMIVVVVLAQRNASFAVSLVIGLVIVLKVGTIVEMSDLVSVSNVVKATISLVIVLSKYIPQKHQNFLTNLLEIVSSFQIVVAAEVVNM